MNDATTAIAAPGATGGIASALCHRLAESGARLVVAARDHARVGVLAGSLGAEPYVVDATQVNEVDACVAFATRVNAVAPGLVRTALTERITASDVARKASIAIHALGRLGEPSDVAAAIAWLLDPAPSWVTGQVVGVDGGLAGVRTRGGG